MEHRFQIYFDVLFIDVMNTKETERKVMSCFFHTRRLNETSFALHPFGDFIPHSGVILPLVKSSGKQLKYCSLPLNQNQCLFII